MTHDTHGLVAGMRVVLANCETDERGTISHVDEDTGKIYVSFDRGTISHVDADELIPEGGW